MQWGLSRFVALYKVLICQFFSRLLWFGLLTKTDLPLQLLNGLSLEDALRFQSRYFINQGPRFRKGFYRWVFSKSQIFSQDTLCSRNFQNVKLRIDFVENWSFYCHSEFGWNQMLVNSDGPKMSFLAILETLNFEIW